MTGDDLKEFVRRSGIQKCNRCWNLREYQRNATKPIIEAPAIWQGRAQVGIPLVFIGLNPSLSGDENTPSYFEVPVGDEALDARNEEYFAYYQNRAESERQAQGSFNKSAVGYWKYCQDYSSQIIRGFLGREATRWEDYLLLEMINCYFNNPNDIAIRSELKYAARTCCNQFLFPLLAKLQPRGVVLLGAKVEKLFPELSGTVFNWSKKVSREDFGVIEINGRGIPVMVAPHPSEANNAKRYPVDHPIFEDFGRFISAGEKGN